MQKIKEIFQKLDILMVITTIYLLLPILIFLILWTKIYYSIIFIGLLIWFVLTHKNEFAIKEKKKLEKKDVIKIIVIMIIILMWLALSGVGGLVAQTGDYSKHNAVLHDLIENNNPVEYDMGNGESGLLVYYIAYYLPAVVVGKLFGFLAANIAIFIWTFIGICIGIFWIFRITKKISFIPVICLIIFSGFDFLGTGVMNGKSSLIEIEHKEWWIYSALFMQLSSFTTLLYWVPHMFMSALIITPMLYFYKDKKMPDILYLFVVASFLWSPFICIGLLPFFLYNCVKKLKDEGIKNIISMPMFLLCAFTTIILVLYILSNNDNGAKMGLIWIIQDLRLRVFVPYFLIFTIFEYGILAYFLKSNIADEKERKYFYITVVILMLFTCIAGGKFNDFCMRATIPALIILYIFFVRAILKAKEEKNNKVLIISFIFAILMSYTCINEVLGRIKETKGLGGQYLDDLKTLQNFEDPDLKKQYISTSYENSIFNKFIKKDY